MKKVIPIRGRNESFSQMAGEAMDTKEAVRGAVIFFEEDGTMHFGEFGLLRADTAMMLAYVTMISVEMMQQED